LSLISLILILSCLSLLDSPACKQGLNYLTLIFLLNESSCELFYHSKQGKDDRSIHSPSLTCPYPIYSFKDKQGKAYEIHLFIHCTTQAETQDSFSFTYFLFFNCALALILNSCSGSLFLTSKQGHIQFIYLRSLNGDSFTLSQRRRSSSGRYFFLNCKLRLKIHSALHTRENWKTKASQARLMIRNCDRENQMKDDWDWTFIPISYCIKVRKERREKKEEWNCKHSLFMIVNCQTQPTIRETRQRERPLILVLLLLSLILVHWKPKPTIHDRSLSDWLDWSYWLNSVTLDSIYYLKRNKERRETRQRERPLILLPLCLRSLFFV